MSQLYHKLDRKGNYFVHLIAHVQNLVSFSCAQNVLIGNVLNPYRKIYKHVSL